ncbi:unnamed protein product [Hapterophycus canaliculatus]
MASLSPPCRCAINAVGRCGRYREAVMLLEQMPEEDIEPDENAYRAAIIACSGANQWGRALALFRNFRRAAAGGGGSEAIGGGRMREGVAPRPAVTAGAAGAAAAATAEAVVPGTAIFNAVITACAKGLYTEEALGFFVEMAELGVPRDEASYNAAIDACARGGLWQMGLDLLAEMQQAGLQPSLASYNAALDGCGREGRWEEAADLISVMRGSMFEDDNGRGEEDAELLEILLLLDEQEGGTAPLSSSPFPPSEDRNVQPRPTAASAVAAAAAVSAETADPHEEAAPFRTGSASLLAPAPPPPRPNVRSYNSCIAACRRAGQYGLARLFFHEMMSRGLRPDVWSFKSAILERVRAPPMTPTAKEGIAAAAAAAPTFPIAQPEGNRGGSVSSERSLHNSHSSGAGLYWREAFALLDIVDGEGLGPDPPCINLVLSECAKAGRWEESRKLLEDLREATPPGSSYRPGVQRYNSVLRSLRNAPARGRRAPSRGSSAASAPTNSLGRREGKISTREDGAGGGWLAADVEEGGGKLSGAEGWTKGHVSTLLGEMRAAGVTPNNETYQCAIRCATDAAMLDIAVARAAAAAAKGVDAVE